MLNLINEELMAFSTINTVDKGKQFTKIRVMTSNKLQQYENDSRYNRNSTTEEKPLKKEKPNTPVRITSNVDVLKPINREIIRISAPLKNIGDFEAQPVESKTVDFDLPMSVNVNSNNRYQPLVEVRCHEQGDDRANMYIIAFPFNGMIRPIPENPQYRIYKGLIASSAKPFFFNNRRYRKVLYLVVEINKNLFKPDHKYHTDKIDISFESFSLFTDRNTEERKTNYENFNLSILSPNGEYTTAWAYSVLDEPVMMSAEPGQPLWTTYDMSARKPTTQNRPNNKNTKDRNTQSYMMDGNVKTTINKHGIRKEIPMNNNYKNQKYSKNNQYQKKNKSIDQMMEESGMFTNEYDNRGKRNGGKRGNNYRRG